MRAANFIRHSVAATAGVVALIGVDCASAAPLPYYGPAVVYGRPLLAADPYYPMLYPYVRGPGYFGHWRRNRY